MVRERPGVQSSPSAHMRPGRIVIPLLVSAVVIGAYQVINQAPPEKEIKDQEPAAADPLEPIPDFTLTAVQSNEDDQRILRCQQGECKTIPPVNQEITNAVTDGQYWYYYQTNDKQEAFIKTAITSGETQTIVEQTPLVAPRGLYISPDNEKILYWLDNVDQPLKKLTELWLYNIKAGGTQLIGEKLVQDAILSKVRWNRSSNLAWFIGDTSEPGEKAKIELLVARTQPPQVSAAFSGLNWENLQDVADDGVMDINATGTSLAYVTQRFGFQMLHVVKEGQLPETTTLRHDIIYVNWRENNQLLYVVQDQQGFSFWQTNGTLHKQIARRPGVIESLRGDVRGKYFVFAARDNNQTRAYALDADQGSVADQGVLPVFSDHTYLVQFTVAEKTSEEIAGITSELTDEEIVAFVEKHIKEIADHPAAQHQRVILTDRPNTIFVDYQTSPNQKERLLVTIRDAIHAEWSISARFEDRAGEWVKVDGIGTKEPAAQKLYEWEDGLDQWILKEDYNQISPGQGQENHL